MSSLSPVEMDQESGLKTLHGRGMNSLSEVNNFSPFSPFTSVFKHMGPNIFLRIGVQTSRRSRRNGRAFISVNFITLLNNFATCRGSHCNTEYGGRSSAAYTQPLWKM